MTSGVEKHLDGDAFAVALTSGIHRVIGEQELLNVTSKDFSTCLNEFV